MGYMRIYGLDVKECTRGGNHHNFWHDRMRAYMACNYGADDRYQTAHVPLSTRD